jgi:hypothetical protein
MMHEGMGGPHLFHLFVRSSDPQKPVTILKVKANFVSLEQWRRSHPDAFFFPRKLGVFGLTSETHGYNAIRFAKRILGNGLSLQDAYMGKYRIGGIKKAPKKRPSRRKEDIRVLCMEFKDAVEADKGLTGIVSRLKNVKQLKRPLLTMDVGGAVVYTASRASTTTYLFQVDNRVVIVSSDIQNSEDFVAEVLRFFNP